MAKKAAKTTTTPVSTSSAGAKPALSKPKKHLKAQAAGVAAAVEGFVQAIVSPHEGLVAKAAGLVEAAVEEVKEAFAAPAAPVEITHEAISIRAYSLYLERKGENGSQAGDWARAEQELRAGIVK